MLPNIARCIKPLPNNPSPADIERWLHDLKHLAKHSHLRGTCLLTAQQAIVDVTSNYRTSLTAFSSVNMLFMLAVVLWISASFALFYIGGAPKSEEEISNVDTSDGKRRWVPEDFTMIVGIVWNTVLVSYLLYPGTLEKSNIPLNNAVIAIVALIAATAVQWHSAYYSAKKYDALYKLPSVPEAPVVPEAAFFPAGPAANGSSFFTTSNFLVVAKNRHSARSKQQQQMQSMKGYQVLGQPFARHYYYEALKVQHANCACCICIVGSIEYILTRFVLLCVRAEPAAR